jgi:hypothetical protein
MQYEIGFLIPPDIDKIEDWKEKLEDEIHRINEIIEKLNLPNVFMNSMEAAGAAQLIKEHLGDTEAIVQVSVEPRIRTH